MSSLRDVLQQFRIPFESEGKYSRPGWIQIHCPFCSGGKDPHKLYAGINTSYGYVNCWRCGYHNLLHTLSVLTGEPKQAVRKILGEVEFDPRPEVERRGLLKLPEGIGPFAKAHQRYLQGRGFDPEEIETLWGVQGIGIAPKLQWRLFIPIIHLGETVSWTTRSIGNLGTRYISASPSEEAVNHKELLYGEDYCRYAIIVCEGPTDVWRIGPGAVATFGTGYRTAQVERMSCYGIRVVCFDNEPDAQARARRLCDQLEGYRGETYNVTLSKQDPGQSPKKEIARLRKRFLT